MKDNQLIFIVSQPRSGSTLLQALLSNNEHVATVSEPWLLLPFLSYDKPKLVDAKYSSQLAAEGIKDFKSKIDTQNFDCDLSDFLLKQYDQIRTNNEKYVLDKTPRYYEILNEIVQLFPKAKIIILKRNPFDVFASIVNTWGHNDIMKLLEFKRDILVAPLLLHEFSVNNFKNPNVKTINYEDLIKDPKHKVQDIYNWLNVEFSEDILNYSNNRKYLGKMGDPKGIHNYEKPSDTSIGKWKILYKKKYWRKFFKGYADYLTADFLDEYGDYNSSPCEQTRIFNHYKERAEWDFNEFSVPLKKLLRNNILRRLKLLKY